MAAQGWETARRGVGLAEVAPVTKGKVVNALTVDVEDYFHVSGFEHVISRSQWDNFESRVVRSTEKILRLLAAAEVSGTFFVLGWVAERHPGLVKRIHSEGHEIGCHSYWHRLVYEQTPDQFRQDLCLARDVLQDIIGERVISYRAPSFSITQQSLWALDVLSAEGFEVDASIYPIRHDRYGMPGTPVRPYRIERPNGSIIEFPGPVWQCLGCALPVGGGGYFRLFPYWVTRLGIDAANRRGIPLAVYLHPWELDPEQPRVNAGKWRCFRHYRNLHKTEERLRQLTRDHSFGTVTTALREASQRQDLETATLAGSW